ncbi:DUF2971 domain-containing protein [Citrobacter koseri]|uniref:DUF2971 domain-containing protein n=1 Tax=Citrobacter koseri TaxID=545 RepID=UPI0029432D8B|nr:DUF2971 domain-containing protein [Citrobacter koseri]WOI99992.1 DUF2971 domain-containing protein [Citrobacter koseri]
MDDKRRYHFTTHENFIKIIESRKVFLFNAFSMKDEDEIISGLKLSVDALDSFSNSIKNNNKLIDTISEVKSFLQDYILKIEHKELDLQNHFYFYILSLCQDIHNDFLWNSYAEHSKGVALEFNEDDLKDNICPYNESDFNYVAIDWGIPEQFMPYMTGYINNRVIKKIHYNSETFINEIIESLGRFKNKEYIESNCATWIILLIFSISSGYKTLDKFDYSQEKETRLFFSLSHTGTPFDIVSYFNKYFYDAEKLEISGRKYIPLHLNPYNKSHLSAKDKNDIILSKKYPFGNLKKVILGKENTSSIEEIEKLLAENKFEGITVEKIN